jgi:hypothetical protein
MAADALPAADRQIQSLVDEAVRAGKHQVELPAGRWRIEKNLVVRGAKGLTISGPQTTLIFAGLSRTGISVSNCCDLVLRGFTIDYDPLPFVQASITARAEDGTWFDIEVHAGYPGLSEAHQPDYRQAYVFEPNVPRWKRWIPDLYPRRVEIRDPRHGRLVFGKAPPFSEKIAVGDRVVLTRRAGTVIRTDNCENVRVEDLTILAGPGIACLGRYMRGDNHYRYTVCPGPKPDGATQPRLISTCADAFNYAYATRGPTLDGCRFSFMGDDSVNLHGVTLLVLRRESPTDLVAAWPYTPESLQTVVPHGTAVRWLRPGNFEIRGRSAVDAFTVEKGRREEDLAAIARVWPRLPQGRGTVWRLKLSSPLAAEPGDLLDLPDSNSPDFTIRNCLFEDHRARGLRVMASRGVIESNTFRRIRMSAISLGNEYGFWREAGWIDGVAVRGNTIEDVCQEQGAFSPRSSVLGAISVFAHNDAKTKLPYWPGNRNVLIENNRIHGSATAGIFVSAARDVHIRGNRMENVMYHPAPDAGIEAGIDLRDAIDVRHATGAQMEDNTVIGLGQFPTTLATP